MYGIKAGKSYQIEVRLNDGSGMALPMRKDCDDTLAYIESMVPYIIIGYNDEINKIYNHNQKELEKMVDERRHQYFQQVPMR